MTATRAIEVIVAAAPVAAPPVIAAPADAVVVAANAEAGLVTTFVLESGVGTFGAVADGNLRTGGGDEAAVSLAAAAVMAFESDNLTLSLTLTATGDGGSDTATIRFVSAPLAINNNAVFSKPFSSEAAVANAEVLAGGASGLAILHFNGTETYTLSRADFASFDVDRGTGEVMIGSGGLAADTTYNFDLQLIGGESGAEVTATRAIQVIVDAAPVTPPDPPDEDATAVFMADIEKSDFDWFSAGRIVEGSGGSSIDWDNDEIANPYDWTPLPGVTLTTGNEDGSADNRWPIYNVWQLQAIDGMSVSRDGDKSSSDAFFGANRLSLHYRLAANIDAMPTRKWKNSGNLTVGFDPIGDTFAGSFDGEGREIRGLYMNLNGNAGLFHGIGADATVSRLGLPDVEIRGSGASNPCRRRGA